MVEPKRHISAGFLLVLLCLGIIPGIIYYFIKAATCPMCNSEHWGIKPSKGKKK